MTARRKLFVVGPLPTRGDVIGGTKVSFTNLVRVLGEDPRFDVTVHDIARPLRGLSGPERLVEDARSLLRLLRRLGREGRAHDLVMLNTSAGGALFAGPLVWLATRWLRRPLVVRLFGGDFDLALARAPRLVRALARWTVLRAELVLVQTHGLVEALGATPRLRWWPTTRDLAPSGDERSPRARRFLFLGQMRAEKGVAEALDASDALPHGATLTLHGPAMPGFDPGACGAHPRAEYRGPLAPEAVRAVLDQHDVLVLPSYHDGEGLPGVLIEALQCGLPVIATRWRALPEVVLDGECGLLVAPRSATELAAAMQRLADDEVLLARLRRGALERGARFRGEDWNARLGDWLCELTPRADERRSRRTTPVEEAA